MGVIVALMLGIFGTMFARPDMMREPGEPPLVRELMLKMDSNDHKRMDDRQRIRETENARRKSTDQSKGNSDGGGSENQTPIASHQEGDDLHIQGERVYWRAREDHKASLRGWDFLGQETFEACSQDIKEAGQ